MNSRDTWKILGLLAVAVLLLAAGREAQTPPAQTRAASAMPKPRPVAETERRDIVDTLAKRFRVKAGPELRVRAAGPYRFAGNKEILYIDRTDVGSVAFERARYGTAGALEPSRIAKEALLGRTEAALRAAGFDVKDYQFSSFEDEYAGTTPKKGLPKDFDPRRASKHVARAVAFERSVEGLPVFGSELLVGLDPDGSIGRFRLHWPRLEPRLIEGAQNLQRAVQEKKWTLPKELQENYIEILDVRAGVGHSAFADPQFRAAAVVRVLYRKMTRETKYPLSSTGYKYFDAAGKEILFSAFPKLPGTPTEKKQKEAEPGARPPASR